MLYDPSPEGSLKLLNSSLSDPLTIRKSMSLSPFKGTVSAVYSPKTMEFTNVATPPKNPSEALEKDPSGKDAHAPGAKLDSGKLQPWLFFSGFANALEEVAKVTTVGAQKYTRNGWVSVDNGQERYMEAFGRHLLAYGQGKEIDDGPKGTGCLHLSQCIWNLLAVLELQLRSMEKLESD